jgi:hypothetical protein
MVLRWLILVPILAFTFFQNPDAHSPTVEKTCTPGVSFWKLLDEVSVGYKDGRLQLGTLYAVCLPPPTRQSTSNYPYDPDNGASSRRSSKLRTARLSTRTSGTPRASVDYGS